MAMMFMMIYRYHGMRLVPRNTSLFLIGFMLFAALISLTRGVWASVVLSYLLGIRYMGAKQRARTILITGALIGLVVFVIPTAVNITMNGWSIETLIQDRVQLITGNSENDLARQSRLISSYYAAMEFIKSPVWGLGVGYPIYVYDVHSRSMEEDLGLHNSALYYGVKVGGIGLLALIAVIVGALRRAGRVAGAESANETAAQREVRAFAQALLASVIPFTLIGPWSANLNYFPFMSLLGLYTGLNWDRLVQRAGVSAPQKPVPVGMPVAGSAE
jgi:O-antigen ligase